jgi:outer membrane receptor protein involved in Fe transport
VTANVALHVNDKIDLPIKLDVGNVTEKIVVSGEIPLLQTENAELSTLIASRQINDLPLNGRDFNQLVDLVPGVSPDNGRVKDGVGLNSDTSVSISGAQSNSNLFLVDGEYNLDSGGNGNLLVTPSIDSIEEFKILRNNYSAEFGSATGGVINVVTKSGGQDFHGSVFDFYRNDKLDATDTFLNSSGQTKSRLHQNDYGFSIGGPVFLPKVYNENRTSDFFFISTEWRHETRGHVVTDFVPTTRQRQGILDPTCAVTPAPCTPLPADPQELTIVDSNGNPEPNVLQAQIDPNATALLNRYPLPNADAANGFNWINSASRGTKDNTQLYKWDHNFGSRYIFSMRYIGMTSSLAGIGCDIFGICDDFPSTATDWTWHGKNVIAKLTATLTPRLVNDFQFGYSNNSLSYVTAATADPTLSSRAGFTYTELFPETSGSFPSLNQGSTLDGFAPLGHGAPFRNRTDNFQWKDDISYAFGKHNIKFGGFMRFNRKKEPANGGTNDTAGQFSFNSFFDLLNGNFATYQEEKTLNNVYDRERDYALYVQDTWKVTQNLTLDLGLRYQVLAQIFSATNNISNFRPSAYNPTLCTAANFDANGNVDPICATNGIVTPTSPGVGRATLPTHYGDFEPRIGIAWQPGFAKNLVVRTGFGIFAGRDALSQTSSLGQQLPNDIVANVTGGSFAQLGPFNPATPQPPARLFALAAPYLSPTTYQYNFGVQYQLGHSTLIDVSYVGNHGIHLGRNRNINQLSDANRQALINGTLANPDTARPFLGYNVINYNERVAVNRYNSLQVGVNHRIAHGFQIQGSYTHSRNISNTANQDTEAAFAPVQNAFDTASEKALANQDTPNSLSVNYIWELPFFSSSHGFTRQALYGWKIVGISTWRSGVPLNVCLTSDVAGTGTGAGAYECQRPDLVGDPNLPKSQRTLGRYFNTAAYAMPQPGTFGNAGRNVLRGPGINNWDLSLFKDFEFPWFGKRHGRDAAETAKLEFRGEMFNVFNHPQYSLGNAGQTLNFPDPAFGVVTTERNPREIQLAVKLIF